MIDIQKYDIITADLSLASGSEQKGVRPCLVIQNNHANKYSNTTVVCPFTSSIKNYPDSVIVESSKQNGLKQKSRLKILHIRSIDKSKIGEKIGTLEDKYKPEFREKFTISFDIHDIL
jgi:mRNA interferase MazF